MTPEALGKPQLTRGDIVRLLLTLPVAALVFVAAFLGISSLERIAWGQSVSWIDNILVISITIGYSIFAGAFIAPSRFTKKIACIISAILFVFTIPQYLWLPNGSYSPIISAIIGAYFILPIILSKKHTYGHDTKPKTIFLHLILAIIVLLPAIPFAILAALAHYLPNSFPMIFVALLLFNAIGTGWRWVVDRKITGISLLFALLGRLLKYLPFGILFSLVLGAVAAVSGHAPLSPYAAIGGLLAFVGVVIFAFARDQARERG